MMSLEQMGRTCLIASEGSTINPASVRLREIGRQVLYDLTPDLRSFTLLDFPHHNNIGDSAIWLGEVDYFRSRGLKAAYVCSVNSLSWDDLDRALGDGPIFLHGGGNFGDLWPQFQDFRESVLARYPGRRVIQLPQSLHYASNDRLAVTAKAIRKHGAFTLLVRDEESYNLARGAFDCETLLCPDMAFHIKNLAGKVRPRHDILLHLREDKESALSADLISSLAQHQFVADWPDDPPRIEHKVMPITLAKLGLAGQAFRPRREPAREELYRQLSTYRVKRGVRLLTSARRVVTDRLHGHILSTLLNIPHHVYDNSYGKIGRFIRAWSTDVEGSLTQIIADPSHIAAAQPPESG